VGQIYKASKLAFSDINRNRRLRPSPRSPCAGVATGPLKTPRTQLKKRAKTTQHGYLSKITTFPHLEHRSNIIEYRGVTGLVGIGARDKFGAPCSNLKSFGSKCTVLKEVLVTLLELFGFPIVSWRPINCYLLAPLVRPLTEYHSKTALDTGMQRQDKAYAATSKLSARMPIVLPMNK